MPTVPLSPSTPANLTLSQHVRRIDSAVAPQLLSIAFASSVEELASSIFDLLSSQVQFHSLVLFHDLVSRVRPTSVFALDSISRSNADWQQLVELHPMLPFLEAKPGTQVMTLDDIQTRMTDLRTRAYYRRVMAPEGFDKQAVLPFWKDGYLRSILSIRRGQKQPPFTCVELTRLRTYHPFILAAMSRMWQSRSLSALERVCSAGVDTRSTDVGFFDMNLVPITVSAGFWQNINFWFRHRPPQTGEAPIRMPPEILNAVGVLREQWASRALAEDQVHHVIAAKRGERTRAARILLRPSGKAADLPPLLEILLEQPDKAAADFDSCNALSGALTPAERGIVRLLGRGLTNAQIAAELGKSIGTVKIQLNSVFRKVGVPNRTTLLTLLR